MIYALFHNLMLVQLCYWLKGIINIQIDARDHFCLIRMYRYTMKLINNLGISDAVAHDCRIKDVPCTNSLPCSRVGQKTQMTRRCLDPACVGGSSNDTFLFLNSINNMYCNPRKLKQDQKYFLSIIYNHPSKSSRFTKQINAILYLQNK